jgi:beta-glucosidase
MPWHSDQRDGAAVRRWDALLNRMFIEPALGLGYPVDALPVLAGIEKYILGNDRENLVFDFDFVGLQNYTREVVKARWYIPYMRGLLVPAKKRGVNDTTAMGWEVYPEGIFRILTQFAAYENLPKVFITENGAAFRDKLTDTGVHDDQRIAFYKAYLASVLQAKRAGIDIGGFLCWTFLDNFEWAEGYHPRFGLVYVDFETQQRTVKDSGLWFREFLR